MEMKNASPEVQVMPVRELIAIHADRLGMKNPELAKALGYGTHNVVSMIKSGAMRLPVNKIAVTSRVLKIDPLYLALCVDAESDFGLAPLLTAVAQRTSITANEERLIQKLRLVSHGLDIDMDDHPDQLNAIVEAFANAADKDRADHAASIERLKRPPRSALGAKDRKAA